MNLSRLLTGLLALVLCLPSSGHAQSPYVDSRGFIPSILWAKYHMEYPYVFLENESTIRLNDDWTVEEDHHYRIRIQKEAAKEMGEQKIYYNKSREEILELQAFVETPDGQTYPATEIQELDAYQGVPMYSDMKVKVITLPQVNVGSEIDVRIKSRTVKVLIPNTFAGMEVYPSEPHVHYKKTYIFPRDKGIQMKAYKPVVAPVKEERDGNEIYTFEYRQTGSIEQMESFLPSYIDMFGLFSFSSIKDWDVIADWYRALVAKNTIDDEKIAARVRELTDGKTSEKDKARAILEFLQDELRYVSMSFGDNTVEPHPSNEIFFNRYGDCKDWSILARQMFHAAGIESHICLFIQEFEGNPTAGLPSVGAFNHAIVQVKVDGETYFADPQLKHFDFGQYPRAYYYAHIFVITDEGYRFDTIRQPDEADATTTVKVVAQLENNGDALYLVKADLDLETSNMLRYSLQSVSPEFRDQFFQTIQREFVGGGEIVDPKILHLDDRYGPVTLAFKVTKPGAYQVYNAMMILDEEIARFFPNPFISRERNYPVFFPSTDKTRIVLIYKLPAGFDADFVPEDVSFENSLLKLSRTIQRKQGFLYATYEILLKRGSLPVNRYLEMREAWEAYHKALQEGIVLKRR